MSGGFLEVQPGTVNVLADTAVRADDIDEANAAQAMKEAQVASESGDRNGIRRSCCASSTGCSTD